MKKISRFWIVSCVWAIGNIFPVQAQFLKNLKKAVENVSKEVEKVAGNSSGINSSQSIKLNNTQYEGLSCGNFGTDDAKHTCIPFQETVSTKKIVLDETYGMLCGDFSCGLAFIHTTQNGSFYINDKGDKVFEVSNKSLYNSRDMEKMKFGNNRVIDCINKENGSFVYKAILYDNNGKVVKVLSNIERASNFVDGVALVKTHPVKFGDKPVLKYINTEGEFVFPHLNIEGWYDDLVNRPLCEGLAAYQKRLENSKIMWGFRDINGKEVIPAEYLDVLDFRDGMAAVCQKVGDVKKWGFIDTTGKLVIPCVYSVKPSSFSDGYAVVLNKNNEQFYIDKSGNIVKGPFKYGDTLSERVSSFHNGYALLYQQKAGCGVGDTFILNTSFDKVAYFKGFDSAKEDNGRDGGYVLNDEYILGIDRFGTTSYTIISLKGNLMYDDLFSDFHEGKALYITNYRYENRVSSYVNRKGEILVQFVRNEF